MEWWEPELGTTMRRIFKGCISNLDYIGFPYRLMRIMVSVFTENIKFLGGGSEHRTLENSHQAG